MPLVPSSRIPLFGRVCGIIALCCGINLIIWNYYSVQHGGDALNGTIEDGRYFFSEHGVKTEVSADVWRFSKSYTKVTLWASAIGGVALLVLAGYAIDARERVVED